MKKIVLSLITLCSVGLSVFAAVDNQYMLTPQYMVNTGYSAEMSKMASIAHGDPHREPYVERNTFKNIMKRSYNYLAPTIFSDMNFYNHSGNFDSTTWKDL